MKIQRLGLISRIALLVVCVEITAFGFLGWFYIHSFSQAIDERTYLHLNLVGKMIASQELQISVISQSSVMSDLVGAPYLNGMVIGGNGRIIVSTNTSELGNLANNIPSIDPRWLVDKKIGTEFIAKEDTLTAVMHINDTSGSSSIYTTLITISTADLNASKRSIALWGQLGSLFFVILSTAGIVLIAQRLITRRVSMSLKVLRDVENGDINARIPILSNDELGQLQLGINSMTIKVGALLNQHRRNEAELLTKSRLLDSIIENIPNVIFLKRASDLSFELFNKSGEQLLGMSRQDVLGKNAYALFPKDQADLLNADDREVLKSSEVLDIPEELIDTHDGRQLIMHTQKLALRNSAGEPEYLLGISEDITERKLAELQQRIAAAAFETSEAIMITDADVNIIRVNKAFEKISGYSEDELIGKNPRILNSGRHDAHYFKEMWLALIDTGSWSGELWSKNKSGDDYPIEISISAVKNAQGKITNYVSISIEITQRIAIELERQQRELELYQHRQNLEQLVQIRTEELSIALNEAEAANKAKSDFLSSMSHELRTPMNGILGFGQLLFYDDTLQESQKDSVNEILNAGNHLLELINDVLDLAKVESGNIDLSLEPVELSTIVEECLGLIRPLAAKRNISITQNILMGFAVRADRTRLKQILLNLLSNAIKYNREGGRVELGVKMEIVDRLRIFVTDTGLGIPASRLKELFLPFNRLDAEKSNIEGTGIGLTITRRIVEMMGGSVDFNSEVGVGSTFWIELPLENREESTDTLPLSETDTTIQKTDEVQHTVLYIEDNPSNLKLVTQILGRRKYVKLLTAHTAELGIELAISSHPDLILLDINMPNMDGYQVLKVLQGVTDIQMIPIIAVTANAMARDIERGIAAGFTDYLTKPFNILNFNILLDKFLHFEK